MKKSFLVVALLIALLGITALANGIVLHTILGPTHLTYLIHRFQQFYAQTGIKVEATVVPYGRDENAKLIASMMAGGSQYDFFNIDCVEVPFYADTGWVLPINKWLTPSLKKDVVPFAFGGMAYKGKWYGLPWASEWKSFIYNKSMIEKVGYKTFPRTWKGVVELAQKLQKAGIVKYASAWSWAPKESLTCDFVAILSSFGGKFFDENGNPLFDSKQGVEALQFMVDMIHRYKIADPSSTMWTESDVYNQLYQGKIAFGMEWGLPLVNLNNPKLSNVVGQCAITLMPSKDGKYPYTVSGPMGWAISYGTKHPKAAWEFIKFLAGPKGALDAALKTAEVPGWKSVWENPEYQKNVPGLSTMLEQQKYVVNRPRVPWYLQWAHVLDVQVNNALLGVETPQQALNNSAKAAIKIKKEYESRKAKVSH